MTDRRHDLKLELISEEAAEWFVRIKDRDVSQAELQDYVKWLKQSPLHVGEFLRQMQNFVKFKKAELPAFEKSQAGAASNIVEWMQKEISEGGVAEFKAGRKKRSSPVGWKIAAAIAVVTVSVLVGVVARVMWLDRTLQTGVGEWRQVALSDGSTLRLAPLTGMEIEFNDRRRTVNLLRGQAFFQVAKDNARPFLVNVGFVTVRAVGTQFAVSRERNDAVVTVSEGEVAVHPANASAVDTIAPDRSVVRTILELPVSAHEQLRVSPQMWPSRPTKVNVYRELAWTRQQLIFETESIAEAAEQFNRLNRIQISVDDPEIAKWRACCAFTATDPESFAEAMAEDPGISLVRDRDGVLHLVAERHDTGDTSGQSGTI